MYIFLNLERQKMKVDNAIILAAGTSSRFAPLSYETHKALIEVKNEVLIERQINQLLNAGLKEIYIVTGYKAELFEYLKDKYKVRIINNPEYLTRNNNGSIWAAREILCNSYVCSADNYFVINPFETEVDDSYYAALYSDIETKEWCMTEDGEGYIDSVTIGGRKAWYMLGHTFWSSQFSKKFLNILEKEYKLSETANKLWESIFISHLNELKMKIRRYDKNEIYEFDTLDELRVFDESYKYNTRSEILKRIAKNLETAENQLTHIDSIKGNNAEAVGFTFYADGKHYSYMYKDKNVICTD